jgi:membrane-associated protease RseP (regulator of RpoE activity)
VTGWFIKEIAAGGAVEEREAGAPESERSGSPVGLVVLAGLLGVLWWQTNVWIFLTVVALIVCVFLHEVGHFVTARWAGMKVTQFFLGFGPRLWSVQRGEVEYGVRAVPAGAFVRIIGMNNLDEVDPADEARSFRSKGYWWRMLVMSAGSLMHFLIAFVTLAVVFIGFGRPVETGTYEVGAVVEDSAARDAGFLAGDRIVEVNGAPVDDYEQDVLAVIAASAGEPVEFTLEREGRTRTTTAAIRTREDPATGEAVIGDDGLPVGFLGIQSQEILEHERLGPVGVVRESVVEFGDVARGSVEGIGRVFSPSGISEFWRHLSGDSDDLATRPTSVVGVAQQGGVLGERAGAEGWLYLVAVFNIFIGLFNLIPLLPFDGGHIAIATYEAIRSRKGRPYHADVSKMIPVAMTVVVVLSFFFLGALWLDLVDPIGG